MQCYFAGGLFDHKQLAGNLLLAQAVERLSDYKPLLPQHIEFGSARAETIRNGDIKALLSCKCALFQFDGTELDSGTVVEFMLAKMADIPAVILRTDFRKAGDQESSGNNFNLMCSFYPRTEVVELNAMACYHEVSHDLSSYYNTLAEQVISALNRVTHSEPLPSQLSPEERYRWILSACGSSLAESLSQAEFQRMLS